MSPAVPTWNQALRFLFMGTILLQTAIVLACVAFDHANAEAGLLRYRLPQFLFWVYVGVGVGAPGTAMVTLITLWAKRYCLRNHVSNTSKRALRHLIILCIVNVCAVGVWFAFVGRVFLGAGGSR